MAVTPNLGLASPLAAAVSGWIARIKSDFALVDDAFGGMGAVGNLLVNPSFEFNQRSVSAYTGNGVYGLDWWQITTPAGETVTVTWDAAEFAEPSSGHSARVAFTKGPGSYGKLVQIIEGAERLKGRPLAGRILVKCATPNAVRAFIQDRDSFSFSPYHSGSGLWEALDVARTLDVGTTQVTFGTIATVDSTHWADNATLVHGLVPLPYVPLSLADELLRCERYYEIHGGGTGQGHPVISGYASGADQVIMRSWSPRAHRRWGVGIGLSNHTITGSWALTNCRGLTVLAADARGFTLGVTSNGAGQVTAWPDGPDDTLIIEWNPTS